MKCGSSSHPISCIAPSRSRRDIALTDSRSLTYLAIHIWRSQWTSQPSPCTLRLNLVPHTAHLARIHVVRNSQIEMKRNPRFLWRSSSPPSSPGPPWCRGYFKLGRRDDVRPRSPKDHNDNITRSPLQSDRDHYEITLRTTKDHQENTMTSPPRPRDHPAHHTLLANWTSLAPPNRSNLRRIRTFAPWWRRENDARTPLELESDACTPVEHENPKLAHLVLSAEASRSTVKTRINSIELLTFVGS